jgi:hypothetical protein
MTSTALRPRSPRSGGSPTAVEELGRLPVLSATVRRVQTIAESEEAGIGDRVAALEGDQGLATDLLRYANSAACARPLRGAQHPRRRHARRPQGDRAARRRGRDLPLLPTRAGQRRPLDRPPAPARRRGRGVSQSIAERAGASADIAHLGGLLHDVLIGAASSALDAESLSVVLSRRRGAVTRPSAPGAAASCGTTAANFNCSLEGGGDAGVAGTIVELVPHWGR